MSTNSTRAIMALTGAGLLTTAGVLGTTLANASEASQPADHSPAAVTREADVDQPVVEVAVDGLVKPNSELTVLSPCTEGDTSARITSTFGVSADMGPAADMASLIGYLTLPNNIGGTADHGPHHLTVTCASGARSTVALDGYNAHGAGSPYLLDALRAQ